MELFNGVTVVNPGDSFERWHQATCRNFSLTKSSRPAGGNFNARVSLRDFGRLALSEIFSSTSADTPIRVTRSAADIRRDPRDYFMLWLALGGTTSFVQGGRLAKISAGDLMLHDQTQPFALEFGQRSHALMITIPRQFLVSRLPSAGQLTARRVSAGTRLGAFAGSIVRQLIALDGASSGELVDRMSTSAMDLVLAALERELTLPLTFQDRRLADVKRYILANFVDTDLDLEAIASNQNVSVRTLNRLFAREGTTPIRWLWQQRLNAAYLALVERRTNRVTDAAFNFGFSDAAHFSRAFRAAFGQSPELVRRGRTQSEA